MYDKQNRTEILFWFLWILISCYNSHLLPSSTKIPLLCCSYDSYRNHISPELKLSIPPCYWTCLTTTTSPHPYPKLFLFALVYVAIFPTLFSVTTLEEGEGGWEMFFSTRIQLFEVPDLFRLYSQSRK